MTQDIDAMADALLNDGWDSIPAWIETQTQAVGYLRYRLSDQIKEYMEAMFDRDRKIELWQTVDYGSIASHYIDAALERNDMMGTVLIDAINEYRILAF